MGRKPIQLHAKPSKIVSPDGTVRLLSDLSKDEYDAWIARVNERNSRTFQSYLEKNPDKLEFFASIAKEVGYSDGTREIRY